MISLPIVAERETASLHSLSSSRASVWWLQKNSSDVPEGNDWLSDAEGEKLNGFRFPKRRADWRLGRWTAKLAIASHLGLSQRLHDLPRVEVRPSPSGAPEAYVAGSAADVTISISHRAGTALVTTAATGLDLGCDLEIVEPRSDAFLGDYFTPSEQSLVASAPSDEGRYQRAALIWSAKESALKALGSGLRLDTRLVEVEFGDASGSADTGAWRSLRVSAPESRVFHGWWLRTGVMLRTLVLSLPPAPPIRLEL